MIHNDIKTADGEFDIFQNITAADVQRVARTYFTPENRLVITLVPSKDGAQGARRDERIDAHSCVGVVPAVPAARRPARRAPRWPSEGPPRPLPAHE